MANIVHSKRDKKYFGIAETSYGSFQKPQERFSQQKVCKRH